jgi:hypothetical protein
MRLVDHDEVEVTDPETATLLAGRVDQTHHGRIGRDVDATFLVPLFQEVHGRRSRQMRLEGVGGLLHQRLAIGEEQHALDPIGAHQQVDQRNHGPGLARTGCHHQQGLALLISLEGLGDAANGAMLVNVRR